MSCNLCSYKNGCTTIVVNNKWSQMGLFGTFIYNKCYPKKLYYKRKHFELMHNKPF